MHSRGPSGDEQNPAARLAIGPATDPDYSHAPHQPHQPTPPTPHQPPPGTALAITTWHSTLVRTASASRASWWLPSTLTWGVGYTSEPTPTGSCAFSALTCRGFGTHARCPLAAWLWRGRTTRGRCPCSPCRVPRSALRRPGTPTSTAGGTTDITATGFPAGAARHGHGAARARARPSGTNGPLDHHPRP